LKYSDFYNGILADGLRKGRPVSCFFELTSRCNFRCRMCYVCGTDENSLMNRELTTEQWIELGRQARDAGVLYITLTGGEIFIRKDFFEIYEALQQMGFIITLFTNASLLNDDMIQRLVKNPPHRVSITIYGASAETYGKVTGNKAAFDKVVNNIKSLKAAGIPLQLKTTVIKYNSGEFRELAELARTMDLNLGLVNYVSPRREGTDTDPLGSRLDPCELAGYELEADKIMQDLYDRYGNTKHHEKRKSLVVEDIMSDEDVDRQIRKHDLSGAEQNAFRCTAGRCAFWFSWEGRMIPCGLMSELYTEPLKNGFEASWSELRNLCGAVPRSRECESCSLYEKCMTCPARRKLESGNYEMAALYLCEHIKAREILRSDTNK
jgi:MoaA/NifB/PqqE/SkfB family radical SAM enzyme